jgi:hypothetical protein
LPRLNGIAASAWAATAGRKYTNPSPPALAKSGRKMEDRGTSLRSIILQKVDSSKALLAPGLGDIMKRQTRNFWFHNKKKSGEKKETKTKTKE